MLPSPYNEEFDKTHQKEIRGSEILREEESRRTQIVDRSLVALPY